MNRSIRTFFSCALLLSTGALHAARFSVEFTAEALGLPGFAAVSNDLSRYLSVYRPDESRTARFGSLVPYPLSSYESNETLTTPIRAPNFVLNPAWVGLGARAHLRVAPAFGLTGEALFAVASDRQDGLSRWFLTDPIDAAKYLGTLWVQARDQGTGIAGIFSIGARFQHPGLLLLSIQPYLALSIGGGPFSYTTTTRALVVMNENWVAGGPTAFSALDQSDLSLAHTLSDDVTSVRSLQGALFRFQAKAGFAFALSPEWTARLELGWQGLGVLAGATTAVDLVHRGEFATSGLFIDPTSGLPTDFFDFPGTPAQRSEAAASRFVNSLVTTLGFERRL